MWKEFLQTCIYQIPIYLDSNYRKLTQAKKTFSWTSFMKGKKSWVNQPMKIYFQCMLRDSAENQRNF